MTTPMLNVTRLRATTLKVRSATLASVRTLAQEGAARRQGRRERARFNALFDQVGNGNDALSRELRAMIIADFESGA